MKKVRVLIVIGTYPLMMALQDILDRDKDLSIVADAEDAYTARDMILEYKPDVMIINNRFKLTPTNFTLNHISHPPLLRILSEYAYQTAELFLP